MFEYTTAQKVNIQTLPNDTEILVTGPKLTKELRREIWRRGNAGLYIFAHDWRMYYVGISQNLVGRLQIHNSLNGYLRRPEINKVEIAFVENPEQYEIQIIYNYQPVWNKSGKDADPDMVRLLTFFRRWEF